MESERKSKIVMKDLINDWAEQKKNITIIMIELERLKKLNTTVWRKSEKRKNNKTTTTNVGDQSMKNDYDFSQ